MNNNENDANIFLINMYFSSISYFLYISFSLPRPSFPILFIRLSLRKYVLTVYQRTKMKYSNPKQYKRNSVETSSKRNMKF